ncbi:hypothetical protein HY480_03600 [Candidatus Uhrbacteria bacterium]|nr:hypothetical protein [Candidatus Uhrbacteria bacterium]
MKAIHDVMTTWGVQLRRMPPRAQEIHAHIARITPQPHALQRGWRMPRLAVGFAILAAIAFVGQSHISGQLRTASIAQRAPADVQGLRSTLDAPGIFGTPTGLSPRTGFMERVVEPFRRYLPTDDTPITDTRELLETSYSARIKTRTVEVIGSRLQTIIRGLGGRVDRVTLDVQYGSIAFAISTDKLDALRSELQSMFWKPFIRESTSAENRLADARATERDQRNAEERVQQLEAQRAAAIAEFQTRSTSFTVRINGLLASIRALEAQRSTVTDVAARERLEQDIRARNTDLRIARAQFASARAAHDRNLARLDVDTRVMQDRIAFAQQQTQDLTERVATVHGTITLEQVAYARILGTFFLAHWIATLLTILAIVALLRTDRRPLIVP